MAEFCRFFLILLLGFDSVTFKLFFLLLPFFACADISPRSKMPKIQKSKSPLQTIEIS